MILINIGVITYNRHDGLIRLLNSLDNLVLSNCFKVENIVIADNSPDFNTSQIASVIQKSKYPIIRVHEKQPGIPFARNKVVEISKDVDFVAFIDDDEFAHELWLVNLVMAQQKFNCAVVQGPVIPKFYHQPKKWHIYSRKQRKTGDRLYSMATGNALISTEVLAKFEGPFNTKLALTGGTDALLGRELRQSGNDLVWCNEAIVYEDIPQSRTTTKWIIQRSFRGGNNFSLQLKILKRPLFVLYRRFIFSLLHLIYGLVLAPLVIFPIRQRLLPVTKIAEGVGGILGLFGYNYNEYRRR